MNEIASQLLDFLINPQFTGWLYYIRLFFITISAILFIIILFLLFKTNWLRLRYLEDIKEFTTNTPLQKNKLGKQWISIKKKFDSGTEGDYKMAVIEADNMLEEVMEKMGVEGESLSEKLNKVSPEKLKNLDDVWLAHKVRNNIVYDPDYKVSSEEIKKTIDIYREAFKNLDVF